jgi:transposase-like protein
MELVCPSNSVSCTDFGHIVRNGSYYRTSDGKTLQRFKCTHCQRRFSVATGSRLFNQKKRHVNWRVLRLLVSGVSQRRAARLLSIDPKTIARKLRFLGELCRWRNHRARQQHPVIERLQFDDMETFEHTKLKPLSVTLAVESESRHIVGFEVSRMPAKGLLAERAVKKYGRRDDERLAARERLFARISPHVNARATLESDENPHYPAVVRKYLPECTHLTTEGLRGCITGQGELKKTSHDPLFSLNHTCAMLRANVNRLFRKTWCTTKKVQSLVDHLEIYAYYHNRVLI